VNPDLIYLAIGYLVLVWLVARGANAAHRRHRERCGKRPAQFLAISIHPVP
jgi:hypothetical protein